MSNTEQHTPAKDPWHHWAVDKVFQRIGGDPKGLGREEAAKRLAEHGPNRLKPAKKAGPLVRFLRQFHDVLIYILIIAAVVTLLLEDYLDSAVIAAVVIINALIGFIQEGKAEQALDAIRKMLSLEAEVLRDGRRQSINAEDLVPGDLVILKSGDKVPADLRLIESRDLRIEEAALTGESVPAEKDPHAVAKDAGIGDRTSMAFSGTLVTSGSGRGLVVATAHDTQIGRISDMVHTTEEITTPLVRQVTHFGKILAGVIVVLAGVTFLIGWVGHGESAGEMFKAAVALAVAAIPEGLPAIMTIVLAIGVQRMAKRNAIIRRLAAVDTLGAVTVICSDKTGTLTRNEMTVTRVVTADEELLVTGVGYEPQGQLERDGVPQALGAHPLALEMIRAGMLCNEARVLEEDGQWVAEGDPMEGALLTLAMKGGLELDALQNEYPTRDTIPFESANRFMATLHGHGPHAVVYVKGAPERLFEMCDSQWVKHGEGAPFDKDYWLGHSERLASGGHRVLAVAHKPAASDAKSLQVDDLTDGLTLLGLFGIIDPPRSEAIEAVKDCHDAGIRVKMITGDHVLTAKAIGKQMGIGDGEHAMTGQEIEKTSDADLAGMAHEVDVFARVSPEHKLRLVTAIQSQGEVTSMTGDGVNDAPALKRADVGIAMGIKGSEVTKEAAEMVLADDNFASIAHAVEEGRTVYDNLRKAILFILPTNGGEAMTILMAVILGRTLPLTPVQVLWVNMITAVTLALALAFEPPERDVMKRSPRDPKKGLLGGYFLWRISFVTTILCAGTFGLFVWMRNAGADEATSRTVAVNTLVMFEVFYLLNCRYITQSVLSRAGLLGSRPVLIAIALVIFFQMLFTYVPFMQMLFDTAAIGWAEWTAIVLVSSTVFFLVEGEKAVVRQLWPEGRH